MTISEFIEQYNALVRGRGASLLDAEFIVFNPNTASVDEVESICINGNAIQINIREDEHENY